MTKIYLVKVTYYVNHTFYEVNLKVFTNRKLAETYYKYLETKPEPKWIRENKTNFREYEIKEINICKKDYTDELLKLQMEQLPY